MQALIDLARKLKGIFAGSGLSSGFPDEWQLLPPLHINEGGWLEGDGVVTMKMDPSWRYPRLSTPHGDPLAIVCHTSQTDPGTGVVMAKNRMRPRTATDRAASWHCSVEANSIVQMASFEVGCWHAIGAIKGIGPANRTAVGIELVGYEKGPFPEPQVMQACRLWRALVQSYGIKREVAMVPHSIVDPKLRSDPGPEWMTKHAPNVLAFAYA